MAILDTLYAPRSRTIELLERGKANLSTMPIYREGALVAPTSALYTLKNASGTTIIDASGGTIVGDIAQYSHSIPQLSSQPLGDGYRQIWALTISGETYHFERETALCRRRLYPVISDIDLLDYYTDLDSLRPSEESSYQKILDTAFFDILQRISQQGILPFLIMSPQSLRQVHLDLTLSYIFRNFHSSAGEGRYLELYQLHNRQFEQGWAQLRFDYDMDQDGETDAAAKIGVTPIIYTSGSPRWHRRR